MLHSSFQDDLVFSFPHFTGWLPQIIPPRNRHYPPRTPSELGIPWESGESLRNWGKPLRIEGVFILRKSWVYNPKIASKYSEICEFILENCKFILENCKFILQILRVYTLKIEGSYSENQEFILRISVVYTLISHFIGGDISVEWPNYNTLLGDSNSINSKNPTHYTMNKDVN